ncbi:MAG: YbgC/FadM family acyl-CoA thioesterase [Alphaproteobacteria bacterium]|nr:YbgC/FadM family acyl-CoA thioesterase [Alphaproteobacteria bacterium]
MRNTSNYPYEMQIFIEDTDSSGVVYHSNYLKYMERARTMTLYHFGIDFFQLMKDEGITFFVNEVSLSYHNPGLLGDKLTIYSEITDAVGARLKIKHSIVRDSTVLVTATVGVVSISLKNRKPVRMPAVFAKALTQQEVSPHD